MNKFDNYFGYSNREKRGIILLFAIILIVVIANSVLYHYRVKKAYDFTNYEKEIDSLILSSENINNIEIELFYFDPNIASESDLIKLGIPQKTTKNIINYRNKGGIFRKPEDLAKIYGFDSILFNKIKPFIILPDTKTYNNKKTTKQKPTYLDFDPNTITIEELEKMGIKKYVAANIVRYREKIKPFQQKTDLLKVYGLDSLTYKDIESHIKIDSSLIVKPIIVKIELNSATEIDLQKIKGIGEVFSKRIIAYKTKLGGYYNIEQLKEVYGLNDELFEQIKAHCEIDKTKINCININTADYKTLISHPYIEKEETIAILNYREMVGSIKNIEELSKQKVITKELYQKIAPYLCTE